MAIVLANPGGPVTVPTALRKGPKLFIPLPKRQKTRWGPIPKRKRWGQPDEQKTLSEDIRHLAEVAGTMDERESQIYFLKLKLAQNAQKLYNHVAALAENPDELSPSPPPQYDTHGKRLNTREWRYRMKLEGQRNDLLTEILRLDPTFKIPSHWKKPVYTKKVVVPVEKHPEINFFGLIVGPRGIIQKRMSQETGCHIFIRGRGSFTPGKPGRVPQEDDNDPMYIAISGPTQAQVDKAYQLCMDLLTQSASGEAYKNKQLAELKNVLGWGGNLSKRCRICGGVGHPIWKCPDRPGADWTPAEVQCALCGEVSHITTDCKLYQKDAPAILQKKALTLDQEYSKFLHDLAGDGSMTTKTAGAITGSTATTAEAKKAKVMGRGRGENARVYQGIRGRAGFPSGRGAIPQPGVNPYARGRGSYVPCYRGAPYPYGMYGMRGRGMPGMMPPPMAPMYPGYQPPPQMLPTGYSNPHPYPYPVPGQHPGMFGRGGPPPVFNQRPPMPGYQPPRGGVPLVGRGRG